MSHETDRTRYILPKLGKGNYNTLMKLISNSLRFSVSDSAKFRLHVLDHYYKHGMKSTCYAFNLPRSTVYVWKKTFENSKKKINSLVPKSTRPINTRLMALNPKLLEFIKSMRDEHGNLSKYKIKPFLDAFARQNNLPLYGTTKIGVIIKRNHYFFETRVAKRKFRKRPLTARLKHAPKEKYLGYVEMDSISVYVVDKKYYFITAIDIVTKFAWVKIVPSLSSRQATLALKEFKCHYRKDLRAVQTDNGSEFLGEFDIYLSTTKIKHEFIYLRSPKINGVVERFNRTIQEEFIQRNDDLMISDKQKFNLKLQNYLIWYNTKRPHYSLGQIPPTEYMQRFI
jgi:transposase InsO family protein